jgi:hypothetical protein
MSEATLYEGRLGEIRGTVTFGSWTVTAWSAERFKPLKTQRTRTVTLNGVPYAMTITRDTSKGSGRFYAYFRWNGERLFFQTPGELQGGEVVTFAAGRKAW